MTIHRVTARWDGFPGAPGYTSFYFEDLTAVEGANLARTRVRAFFSDVGGYLAPNMTITVDPSVEGIDEATGQITQFLEDPTEVVPVKTSSTGTYAGPAGAVINWRTTTLRNGRLVRGRTFLVPLSYATPCALDAVHTVADVPETPPVQPTPPASPLPLDAP